MKKRSVVVGVVVALLAVPLVGAFAGWLMMIVGTNRGQPYIERTVDNGPHHFVARALFAASDADMIGTSYGDGVLHPIEGAHDTLSRIDVDQGLVHSADATVTNSVMTWPGTLELSPDARYAYVIESRGTAPAQVDRVKNVHKDLEVVNTGQPSNSF